MQFLDEQNIAGQALLRLVSRANAIVAELLRLSAHVPPVFKLEDKATQKKYGEILMDFSYDSKADQFQQRIERDPAFSELDDEFKDNYMPILKRFWSMFESIFKYITDLNQYVDDVEQGVYIQSTLELILKDETGKQLMCEALYLYGVMLLLLDQKIDGVVRERMLVCYFRHTGAAELANLKEVCKLCARTGFQGDVGKRPANYPESFLARFTLPERVVSMIIGKLRSDDIYSQIAVYPLPEHRSTALATQGAMIYVCLFFQPRILNSEAAAMREIVDKHFPDNWVVPWYLGFVVDMSVMWQPYKAAIAALNNTIEAKNVMQFNANFVSKLVPSMKSLRQLLTEGILTEDFILERRNKIMGVLRDCNVLLRWLVLHTRRTVNRRILDLVVKDVKQNLILDLLLDLSQFEFLLKRMFQGLLNAKQAKWEECKTQAAERMRSLGNYFSGEMPLVTVKKNEKLQQWFSQNLAPLIDSLDFTESVASTRKIQQLLLALEEVEQFHAIDTNHQVKPYLVEARGVIKKMLRIANLGEDVMVSFAIVTDCSYMFEIANDYVEMMQLGIKKDPGSLFKLRSSFLKFSTLLQIPLVRINEARSRDLLSVSQYYSGELVKLIRKVMDVIPKTMFSILDRVILLQTSGLKDSSAPGEAKEVALRELPTQVEKEQLKDYAQLPQRFTLAELTYRVSVFTRGIASLDTTAIGLDAIDPKALLEDGIRKELVSRIAITLHEALSFDSHKLQDFEHKLIRLATILDGFRRSFQYIQDYINIYGLKIWQEEFSRIVHLNVEQECNTFLKKKVLVWDSKFQNDKIPIPIYPPIPASGVDQSVNFIGRIGRELIYQTASSRTLFMDRMSAWYEPTTGREAVSLRSFALLLSSIGVFGLTGMDRLFSYMIVTDIKVWWTKAFQTLKAGGPLKENLAIIAKSLEPHDSLPSSGARYYVQALKATEKLWSWMPELLANIGHKQLLRRQIANALNVHAKLDSNMLFEALQTFNESLIKDIQAHASNPDTHEYPDNINNDVLAELSPYLQSVGLNAPLSQIYLSARPIEDMDLILFLLTVVHLSRVQRDEKLALLVPKSKGSIDNAPFVVGVWTLLKQHNSAYWYRYLAYLGQWIRAHINASNDGRDDRADIPPEVSNALFYLEDFAKFSEIPRATIQEYIPPWILDDKRPL
jgi:WASH complex subunit strumpellin